MQPIANLLNGQILNRWMPMVWMMGAIASFCTMAIGARQLSGQLDTFEVLTLRCVVGLIIIMGIIYWRRQPELFITQRTKTHLYRNLFHFYGQASWFFALGLSPLAQVFAIEFTVPIWVMLIAAIFLGESITWRKFISVTLGLLGVIVVIRPGMSMLTSGSIIMLFGAVGFAVGLVFNKSLVRTEHPLTIVFYMSLMQLPINTMLTGGDWTMPTPINWIWIVVVGAMGISAHFCASKAMQSMEVSTLIALDFLRLPIIALLGMWLFHEAFDWWVLLGGAVMILGNIIGLRRKKAAQSSIPHSSTS